MIALLNSIIIVIMMLNLFVLGSRRITSIIRVTAGQGALLGLLPLLMHASLGAPTILMVILTIALKGLIVPRMMLGALKRVQIRREVEPLIGLQPSVMLGAAGTVAALLFFDRLALAPQHAGLLIPAGALATILTGFILLVARYKAMTQVVGYLVLENGVYAFGTLMVADLPVIVELGVLLDLFAAIFVVTILVNRISQAFDSLDTRHLAALKE